MCDFERTEDVGSGSRKDDPGRLDLIDRSVGGVESSAEGVEAYFALEFLPKSGSQGWIGRGRRSARHGGKGSVVPLFAPSARFFPILARHLKARCAYGVTVRARITLSSRCQ